MKVCSYPGPNLISQNQFEPRETATSGFYLDNIKVVKSYSAKLKTDQETDGQKLATCFQMSM